MFQLVFPNNSPVQMRSGKPFVYTTRALAIIARGVLGKRKRAKLRIVEVT